MKKEKVVVGMSGGVDSSIAMMLLKRQGYEPVGVSLKYDVWQNEANDLKENVCCSDESFQIARHVCEKFDAPYHIVDSRKSFEKEIVGYFKEELKAKRTPNPCVVCNRVLKFKELFDFAKENGIDKVATGHYARILKDENGEYGLYKGKDSHKDQTYTLSFLKKEWLKNILFPLGEYTKAEVFEFAKETGFDFYLYRKQSQDFCYVSDKAMQAFLEKEIGIEKGPIIDTDGNVLGEHRGLHFYTIGQRKGIQVENGPWFVTGMDTDSNTLIITKMGKSPSLYKTDITLSPCNLLMSEPKSEINVQAKIRYQQELSEASLFQADKGEMILKFAKPQRAVTQGQYAVFYDGDRCLGAGRINSST